MSSESKKGRFIVFEGIDGSGKTTQCRLLCEKIRAAGQALHVTKEPTDRPIGTLLRQFLENKYKTDERAMAMLFAADRLDHIVNDQNGLLPIIQNGVHVVSDRYYLSSYAYQSVSMPMPWVLAINAQNAALLRPSCHVFIDVSPETAIARLRQSRPDIQLYETMDHLALVRKSFFDVFARVKDEETIVVVNGERPEAEIAADIWKTVTEQIGIKKPHRAEDELVSEDVMY